MKKNQAPNLSSEARKTYFGSCGVSLDYVVSSALVHGSDIAGVTFGDGGSLIAASDGLATKDRNTFLSITAADCLPVYFFDSAQNVIGVVHAGWRGVVKGIVPNMIRFMREKYGSSSADILVGIGPGIQVCHFEISNEICDQFDKEVIHEHDGKIFVDLPKMIIRQLAHAGVQQYESANECTFCLVDRYFSYRRDKPGQLETMIAWIGLDA